MTEIIMTPSIAERHNLKLAFGGSEKKFGSCTHASCAVEGPHSTEAT